MTRDADLGRRFADTLAQVWRQGGEETWVLVHVEVQGSAAGGVRRANVRVQLPAVGPLPAAVASLAVLADEQADGGRMSSVTSCGAAEPAGFSAVKLLDYRSQWSSLEQSRNPFATMVMAHLKAQETRRSVSDRPGNFG